MLSFLHAFHKWENGFKCFFKGAQVCCRGLTQSRELKDILMILRFRNPLPPKKYLNTHYLKEYCYDLLLIFVALLPLHCTHKQCWVMLLLKVTLNVTLLKVIRYVTVLPTKNKHPFSVSLRKLVMLSSLFGLLCIHFLVWAVAPLWAL